MYREITNGNILKIDFSNFARTLHLKSWFHSVRQRSRILCTIHIVQINKYIYIGLVVVCSFYLFVEWQCFCTKLAYVICYQVYFFTSLHFCLLHFVSDGACLYECIRMCIVWVSWLLLLISRSIVFRSCCRIRSLPIFIRFLFFHFGWFQSFLTHTSIHTHRTRN